MISNLIITEIVVIATILIATAVAFVISNPEPIAVIGKVIKKTTKINKNNNTRYFIQIERKTFENDSDVIIDEFGNSQFYKEIEEGSKYKFTVLKKRILSFKKIK